MVDIEKCRITYYPSPVLTEKAMPIEEIDDNIVQLVEKITDIMLENSGIGLAGPQAGVPLRIFIISLDTTRKSVKVFINPSIEPSGPLETVEEGCLSLPGFYTKISRSKNCTVTATDLDGNEFTEQAPGLYARVLQHEYDHIEGTTIADRMSSVAKITHRKQLKRFRQNYENSRQ